MSNPIIQEYIDIKLQIARLEARKKDIEMDVLDALDEEGGQVLRAEGKLLSYGRKVWQYSPAVDMLAEQLKVRKKNEEVSGIATIKKVTNVLMFTPREKIA